MIAALGLLGLALAHAVPDDSPFTATSIPWRAGAPTKIHGATVEATAVAVLNLTTDAPFELLTNRRRAFDFAPATSVTLARCILPAALGPHGRRGPFSRRRPRRIECLPDDDSATREGPCVLAQDHFLPFTFQHAIINSVPTRGVAALVQKYLLPGATLVVESPRATPRAAHLIGSGGGTRQNRRAISWSTRRATTAPSAGRRATPGASRPGWRRSRRGSGSDTSNCGVTTRPQKCAPCFGARRSSSDPTAAR